MTAYPGVAQIRPQPERDTKWQEKAACVGLPSEVFFPERGTVVTLGARKVCDGCEVRTRCLEYALSHGEWHGTWGGLSVDQRRELVRRGNANRREAARP